MCPRCRCLAIGEMTRRTWEYHRQQLRPLAPRFPIIQRWIRTAERALFPALSALEAAPDLASSTEIGGHQDLWPSHVLWLRGGRDGGGGPARLGGIIDFAEAAASSPLVDLAHLVTHFGGWTADRAETAMGIYSEIRRLSPEERRLLPAVATLDVIAEAGWLLTIAFALARARRPGGIVPAHDGGHRPGRVTRGRHACSPPGRRADQAVQAALGAAAADAAPRGLGAEAEFPAANAAAAGEFVAPP